MIIKFKKKINESIDKITDAIIIHDFSEPDYSLTIDITKKMLANNIHCINIFCEPYKFFGKRHLDVYKKFHETIETLKKDNYYFKCNDIVTKLYKRTDMFKAIELAYEIQYYISINFMQDIGKNIQKVVSRYNKKVEEMLNKQLTIFIGGCGTNIYSKYGGDLKSIYISNYKINKKNSLNGSIILSANTNCLDGSRINYKAHINDYVNKEEDIINYLKNVKEVLIVCGLGGLYGTSGLIYLSDLCKKLDIKCSAIVSLPFEFEGKARLVASQEALEKCKCDEIIKIDMEKFKKIILYKNAGKGTVCNHFNDIDKLFLEYIESYEYYYINKDRLYGKKFNEIIENRLDEELEKISDIDSD